MSNDIGRRSRQFFRAMTARLERKDRCFLNTWLSAAEKELFFAMGTAEQRHSLDVAYSALSLAQGVDTLDQDLLVRSALLHDIGKCRGDMSIADKVLTVLAAAIFPVRARSWAREGKGSPVQNIRHALHIYFCHAEISRERLLALGLTELAEIVAKHHKAPAEDDPPELLLLREADERN